ncbi:MAG TPA: hypothetical protein VMV69_08850 [Pirellulales bacterium]|nr:hypothetical protein [Pirellulales bacterium]
MSHHSRFSDDFHRNRFKAADAEIIGKAAGIKIDLYRDNDGDIHGDWVISGTVSNCSSDAEEVAANLDFAAELLAAFRRARPEQEDGMLG